MNLREKLNEVFVAEGFDPDSIISEILYHISDEANTIGWPEVNADGIEPLDLENYELISISDHELIFDAGGDWQEPHRVQVQYDVCSDKFVCKDLGESFGSGMSDKEFLDAITKFVKRPSLSTSKMTVMTTKTPAMMTFTVDKIDTAECKEAIIDHLQKKYKGIPPEILNPKIWKRTSKRKVHVPIGNMWERTFDAVLPKHGVTVTATVTANDSEIFSIEIEQK